MTQAPDIRVRGSLTYLYQKRQCQLQCWNRTLAHLLNNDWKSPTIDILSFPTSPSNIAGGDL